MTDTRQVRGGRAPVPAPAPAMGVFSLAASVLLVSIGMTYAFAVPLPFDQLTSAGGAWGLSDARLALTRVGFCTLLLGLAPGVIGILRHERPRWPSLVGIALGGVLGLLGFSLMLVAP
jgi:hypothetical protein